MISKRVLNTFIDSNRTRIGDNRANIAAARIREIKRSYDIESLAACELTHAKDISKLQQQIVTLQNQAQCVALTGHDFKLIEIARPPVVRETIGMFECKNCLLKIKRRLTTEELKAAKKLGM